MNDGIRVSRKDLASSEASSSSAPQSDSEEALWNILNHIYDNAAPIVQESGQAHPSGPRVEEEEEEEVEFRLFSTNPTTPAVTKIRIKSPDLNYDSPGLVVAKRPRSYYFASPDPEKQQQFAVSALSGSEVISRSHIPWPGSALQWRVTTVPSTGSKLPSSVTTPGSQQRRETGKKRPGKQARIAKRKQLLIAKEKAEAQRKAEDERELAEKAKRAKKNRDKKLKKRERDKVKKAIEKVEEG